jgi:hypothetical protein
MIIRKLGNDLVDLPMAKTTLLQFTDDTAIIMPAHATSQLERLRNLREAFESLNEYHIIVINYEWDPLIMGYFDNLNNRFLNKYKKNLKI